MHSKDGTHNAQSPGTLASWEPLGLQICTKLYKMRGYLYLILSANKKRVVPGIFCKPSLIDLAKITTLQSSFTDKQFCSDKPLKE